MQPAPFASDCIDRATPCCALQSYDERNLLAKLEYIDLNPVRAGLTRRAVDRRWSSARWYELQHSVGVPIDWLDQLPAEDGKMPSGR